MSQQQEMPSISKEEMLNVAFGEIKRGLEVVGPAIDDMTSAGLKKILKTITYIHMMEHMAYNKKTELNQQERVLIDKILYMQENILGFMKLNDEVQNEQVINETNNEEIINEIPEGIEVPEYATKGEENV